jgi:hypothetical protein
LRRLLAVGFSTDIPGNRRLDGEAPGNPLSEGVSVNPCFFSVGGEGLAGDEVPIALDRKAELAAHGLQFEQADVAESRLAHSEVAEAEGETALGIEFGEDSTILIGPRFDSKMELQAGRHPEGPSVRYRTRDFLCAAAPILIHSLPVLPLLSYSLNKMHFAKRASNSLGTFGAPLDGTAFAPPSVPLIPSRYRRLGGPCYVLGKGRPVYTATDHRRSRGGVLTFLHQCTEPVRQDA